ncbi:HAD family hydrolase [Marinisporobacter balticus]|uniref:Hydroxymethylpyrimidine pyrophosphatase-like HAD family hydrolase n=1 Tax=Marinisporobacter balticus TaxID=2018667 RepID=A0A4R2KP69_9FIRM|nr:haloacid dehalogenase [Marinisporobacter balticus]TCO74407.1 hydroxymethylpyrimidine pyrophosphatase-like HAD family hydrolase [Marinisporobacter balticus]
MIFASDLDRTLIYSKKFISDHKDIRLIEKKEDESISFMTEIAIKKLKKLSDELLFIPVTTRTIEQYRRISILEKIAHKYAIVSNGGNIIIDGEVDRYWSQFIRNKIKRMCLPFKDLLLKFKEIESIEWVKRKRTADNLFTYCIVERDNIPMEKLNSFMEWLEHRNWKGSLQGRKLYFVPKCVCKWEATKYIKECENIDFVASAGDSLLDLPMLKMADYAISPPHGEIYKDHRESKAAQNIIFTEKEGIFAAEEILEKINICKESVLNV